MTRELGHDVDELAFLREVKRAEGALPGARPVDVRASVWERVGRDDGAIRMDPDGGRKLGRRLVWCDVAAALAVLVGAGFLYDSAREMLSDLYWSGSLHVVSQYF